MVFNTSRYRELKKKVLNFNFMINRSTTLKKIISKNKVCLNQKIATLKNAV